MNRRTEQSGQWLTRLRDAAEALARPVTFMEVCGTHTMSAFRCGLHSLVPDNVTLLSGPGCPVCVTAQGDIDLLISLASDFDVTLCTYGDMLRVPGKRGSLEKARGRGADVRVAYSTLDVVKLAQSMPQRQVVFAAVGFETTAPASAAAVLRAEKLGLDNFSVLVSHKRVVPAMLALLSDPAMNCDGFLLPGHVSVIIGSEPYQPIVDQYELPCVITGFEDVQMAHGLSLLAEMSRDGDAKLINDYPEAVKPTGNPAALALLDRVFEPATVRWRGLCDIPDSGLVLRERYRAFSAPHRFGLVTPADREPAKCLCGKVITGQVKPPDCELFATTCTPIQPIGPCMVSSEGTCQAWFKYHRPRVKPEETEALV